MSNATKAEELRAEAAQHEQDRADSFERCDTDGFLSQWASGLNAQKARKQAEIEEAGGIGTFEETRLTDLSGNPVKARMINGRYGLCWALLDDAEQFTGEFVKAHPARESTLRNKGFRETEVEFVAEAVAVHRGSDACNVTTVVEPKGMPNRPAIRFVGAGDLT